jgi:hypothetical protein
MSIKLFTAINLDYFVQYRTRMIESASCMQLQICPYCLLFEPINLVNCFLWILDSLFKLCLSLRVVL